MHHAVARQSSRERTLDYLFQHTIEEQFEPLRVIQEERLQQSKPGFWQRMTQWFKDTRQSDTEYFN